MMEQAIITSFVHNQDCLEGMKGLTDNSIDMICTDLPYGLTEAEWDIKLDWAELWAQYWRVAKPNTPILLFATMPFAFELYNSQPKHFKYEWVWQKTSPTGRFWVHKRPMTCIEYILVFYKKQPTYNPQMHRGEKYRSKAYYDLKMSPLYANKGMERFLSKRAEKLRGIEDADLYIDKGEERYPQNLLLFPSEKYQHFHPTQKPLRLLEYLIKTYTNENDVVLDSCAGSGTTVVAAKSLNRRYVGFETDANYFNVINRRLTNLQMQLDL